MSGFGNGAVDGKARFVDGQPLQGAGHVDHRSFAGVHRFSRGHELSRLLFQEGFNFIEVRDVKFKEYNVAANFLGDETNG